MSFIREENISNEKHLSKRNEEINEAITACLIYYGNKGKILKKDNYTTTYT